MALNPNENAYICACCCGKEKTSTGKTIHCTNTCTWSKVCSLHFFPHSWSILISQYFSIYILIRVPCHAKSLIVGVSKEVFGNDWLLIAWQMNAFLKKDQSWRISNLTSDQNHCKNFDKLHWRLRNLANKSQEYLLEFFLPLAVFFCLSFIYFNDMLTRWYFCVP